MGLNADLLDLPMSRHLSTPDASVAALIGSDLRAMDVFVKRLDDLLVGGTPFHAYISTDRKSIACTTRHRLLRRRYIAWVGETPDTALAMARAFGPHTYLHMTPTHQLHQWWRLRHAWTNMAEHEHARGKPYEYVIRGRTDLRLPFPIPLVPDFVEGLHGANADRTLVMRGDWIFWGRRKAMAVALEYVDVLPHFQHLGQKAYLPLPWRHMHAVGAEGLGAGLVGWLRFPRKSRTRPFGFLPTNCSPPNPGTRIAEFLNLPRRVDELEAWSASAEAKHIAAQRDSPEVYSYRDPWMWNAAVDNEKFFFYHVLNRSLYPVNAMDVLNKYSAKHKLKAHVAFSNYKFGMLLPENIRHHPNCTCVCAAYVP